MAEEESDTGRNILLVGVVLVVGLVFLVVALVIGGAVIGSFVLDTGSSTGPPPNMSVSFDQTDDGVVVTYDSEEPLDQSTLHIHVNTNRVGVWTDFEPVPDRDRAIILSEVTSGDEILIVVQTEDTEYPVGGYEVQQRR